MICGGEVGAGCSHTGPGGGGGSTPLQPTRASAETRTMLPKRLEMVMISLPDYLQPEAASQATSPSQRGTHGIHDVSADPDQMRRVLSATDVPVVLLCPAPTGDRPSGRVAVGHERRSELDRVKHEPPASSERSRAGPGAASPGPGPAVGPWSRRPTCRSAGSTRRRSLSRTPR